MERTYTIPLRKVKKVPRGKRASKAVAYIRSFVEKHMKTGEVKIENSLNEMLWEKGIENIPTRIKVKVVSQEDGSVLVSPSELVIKK